MMFAENFVAEPVQDGDNNCAPDSVSKCINCKSIDQFADKPEKCAIDNDGEKSECNDIERKSQDVDDRFDGEVYKTKDCGYDDGDQNAAYVNATYDIRYSQYCEREYEPVSKYTHRC